MVQKKLVALILAGGDGIRLWPASRKNYPKQFICLNGSQSLFQSTIARINQFSEYKTITICNEQHRFIAENQSQQGDFKSDLILEPTGLNTTAAITIGCLAAIENRCDPTVLVTPSDHEVTDEAAFLKTTSEAANLLKSDQIITFGIKPERPETGFGYLKLSNNESSEVKRSSVNNLLEYIEKPNLKRAKELIQSNEYLWNSGMFLARASTFLELVKTYQQEVYDCCFQAFNHSITDLDFVRLDSDAFLNCPSISFDHGVMELLLSDKNRKITPLAKTLDCGWNDLGSWDAVHRISKKDSHGNTLLAETVVEDSSNCFVKSENKNKVVSMIGMKDTIVVDTKDALLVANINRAQDVRVLVEKLEKQGLNKYLESNITYRPWGRYEVLISTEHHQIKKVSVKPGGRLSLQKHLRRAEHWVVVSGKATVCRGTEVFIITQNESTFIPVEEIHRLENREEVMLELIEVQTGDYFGEDDIERFDDEYGRV